MKQGYSDSTERESAEGGSGLGGPDGQPSAEGVSHQQHDLAQTPGKFTDDAGQATSGEGAVTARPAPDGDDDEDVPAAIAGPSDPPGHEKGSNASDRGAAR